MSTSETKPTAKPILTEWETEHFVHVILMAHAKSIVGDNSPGSSNVEVNLVLWESEMEITTGVGRVPIMRIKALHDYREEDDPKQWHCVTLPEE